MVLIVEYYFILILGFIYKYCFINIFCLRYKIKWMIRKGVFVLMIMYFVMLLVLNNILINVYDSEL